MLRQLNDIVLSQEDKPQIHKTVREISPETGIHRSSVSQIICKDLHLKCYKRCRAQELTDANCAARMKCAKLLLQKFPQYAIDFVFFRDKKMLSVTSPDNQQNKVSGRLRELLKKKLGVFFSADTARSIMPGRLITVPVSRNFLILNSLLTPRCSSFSQEIRLSTSSLCTLSDTNFVSKSCPCCLISC